MRDHGISYSHHKNSVQASERLFVDENNEKDEIIKHLSEINKNLKQENDQTVALINQRLGHVKGLIKNLIASSNKIVRFPLKKTPEMESAVKLYDVNRTALERHLEALDDIRNLNISHSSSDTQSKESAQMRASSVGPGKRSGGSGKLTEDSPDTKSTIMMTPVRNSGSKSRLKNLIDGFERRSIEKENSTKKNSSGLLNTSVQKHSSVKSTADNILEDLEGDDNESAVLKIKNDFRSLRLDFSSLKTRYDKLKDENTKLSQENNLLRAKFVSQGNYVTKLKDLQEQNESLTQDKVKLSKLLKREQQKGEERKNNLKQLYDLLNGRERSRDSSPVGSLKGKSAAQIEEFVRAREKEIQAKMLQIEFRLKVREEELEDLYEAFERVASKVKIPLYTQRELDKMLSKPNNSISEKAKKDTKQRRVESIEEIIEQIVELERAREKLMDVRVNMKNLSLEQKRSVNEKIDSINEEKLLTIQKLKYKSVEKEFGTLENKVVELITNNEELNSQIRSLQELNKTIEAKSQGEIAIHKNKIQQLNGKIRELETQEAGNESPILEKIDEIFDVLQIDWHLYSEQSTSTKLATIKNKVIELNAAFREKEKAFANIMRELSLNSPSKTATFRNRSGESRSESISLISEINTLKIQLQLKESEIDMLNRKLIEKESDKKRINKSIDDIAADLNVQIDKFSEIEAVKKELEDTLYEVTKALAELAEEAGIAVKPTGGNTSLYIIKEISKELMGSARRVYEKDLPLSSHHSASILKAKETENKQEFEKLCNEKDLISLKLKQNELELMRVKGELDVLKSKQVLQDANEQAYLREKDQLLSQINDLERELETQKAENSKLELKIQKEAQHATLISQKTTQNQGNEVELRQLEQQLKKKEEENKDLIKVLESTQNQLNSQRKYAEGSEANLKASNKELDEKLRRLQTQYNQLSEELEHSKAAAARLEKERNELSQTLIKSYEEKQHEVADSQANIMKMLNQKESELNELRHNLRVKESDIIGLKHSINTLNEKLNHEQLLNNSASQQLLNTQAELSSKRAKIQDLESKIKHLENEKKLTETSNKESIENLSNSMKLVEQDRNDLKAKLSAHTSLLQEKESVVLKLKARIEELELENSNLMNENMKMEAENQNLVRMTAELENNMKESLNDTESNKKLIERRLEGLHQEKEKVESNLRNANNLANQLPRDLNDVRSQLKQALEENQRREQELTSKEVSLKERAEEIKGLQNTIKSITTERNALQQKLSQAESDIQEEKVKLARVQNDAIQLNQENQSRIHDLKAEIEKLMASLSEKDREISEEATRTEQSLETIDKLNSELRMLRSQNETLDKSLKEREALSTQNAANMTDFERELAAARDANKSLTVQINTLQTTNVALRTDTDKLENEKKLLEERIRSLEEENSKIRELSLKKDKEIGNLNESIVVFKSKLTEANEKVEAQRQEIMQKGEQMLANETTSKDLLSRELANYKEQIEDLKRANGELSSELLNQRKYYEDKLKELQGSKDRRMSDSAKLQAKIIQQEQVIKESANEIANLNADITNYENQIMKLTQTFQNHFNDYEKKLSQQEAKNQTLEAKCQSLEKQIQAKDPLKEANNELQAWREFANFLNEKADTFLDYLGVPEDDVLLSPLEEGNEFKNITSDINKKFAVIEENLAQYDVLQQNFQKLITENQEWKKKLAMKEAELNEALRVKSPTSPLKNKMSFRSGGGADSSMDEHPQLSNIKVKNNAYAEDAEAGSRVEAEASFTSDDFKSLQDKMKKYQDENEHLNDQLHELKHENANLKFELERVVSEMKEFEIMKEQWMLKERILKQDLEKLELKLQHEKEPLRQAFTKFVDGLLDTTNKNSMMLFKVVISMLDYTDQEKNVFMEKVKLMAKKSNFAKTLLAT